MVFLFNKSITSTKFTGVSLKYLTQIALKFKRLVSKEISELFRGKGGENTIDHTSPDPGQASVNTNILVN